MTQKEKEELEKQYCNCNNHVFALIRRGWKSRITYPLEPLVECVKCGLTNKKLDDDMQMSRVCDCYIRSFETSMFYKYLSDPKFHDVDWERIPLLSGQLINTNEPYIFYEIAKEVNLSINADYEECYQLIYDTIQELIELAKKKRLDVKKENHRNKLIELYDKQRIYQKVIK